MTHKELNSLDIQEALKAIREIAGKATPGEWAYGPGRLHGGNSFVSVIAKREDLLTFSGRNPIATTPKEQDAEFLALCPSIVSYLLRLVEEYRKRAIRYKEPDFAAKEMLKGLHSTGYTLSQVAEEVDAAVQARMKEKK